MKRNFSNINILLSSSIICFCVIAFKCIYTPVFRKECSVSFSIYDDEYGTQNGYTLDELLKDKKFYNYKFTGNNILDNNIFKKYKNAVNLMTKSNDTINCIHFKFNHVTTYQRFIDAFDICFIENANYIYYKDNLWIFSNSIENKKNIHLFDLIRYTDKKPAANRP